MIIIKFRSGGGMGTTSDNGSGPENLSLGFYWFIGSDSLYELWNLSVNKY